MTKGGHRFGRRAFVASGVLATALAATGRTVAQEDTRKAPVPRVPRLAGPWRRVSYSPKLPEIDSEPGEVVDHGFFRAANGRWQLWTQIRGTAIGRLFYRWEAEKGFDQPDWSPRGICWRADRKAGESWNTGDQEFIHAPYIMRDESRFIMYYGGGPSQDGDPQISIATSDDGIAFTRVTDADGRSQAFAGPGYARDAMVIKVDDRYLMYYAADVDNSGAIALRTSSRPFGAPWSDYRVVSKGGFCGTNRTSQQCPFVVFLDGFYYLFKMGPSDRYQTAVCRSKDPLDFGKGDDQLVAVLEASAAEIIQTDGRDHISSLIPGYDGVRVAPLDWEAES